MKLLELLRAPVIHEHIMQSPLCIFKGSTAYPLLFFSLFWSYIKKQSVLSVENFSLLEQEFDVLKRKSAISFLGMPTVYWLGDSVAWESKKKIFNAYFKQYTGPHHIVWFNASDEKYDGDSNIIELPETVDRELMCTLMLLIDHTITPRTEHFVNMVLRKYPAISLDTACLLLHYAIIAGSNQQHFFDQWADYLIMTPTSLFTISQLFFMKDMRNFFVQWHRIQDAYAPAFWISFWSDQVWRAYFFVSLQKQQQPALAKKISFRLPFRFIEHDWRKVTVTELQHAHQFLYTLDYQMKNGSSCLGFDVFFNKFFLNEFVN